MDDEQLNGQHEWPSVGGCTENRFVIQLIVLLSTWAVHVPDIFGEINI